MRVIADKKLFRKFEGLHVGVVVLKGIDNRGDDRKIFGLLEEVENFVRLNFTYEKLARSATISSWRSAYDEFGERPEKYHCSVEGLMGNVLGGKAVRGANKLQDVINYLSLKHIVPVGGFDLNSVNGNLRLCFASGKETFFDGKKRSRPSKGEVILKDDKEVASRKWNWKASHNFRLRASSKDSIILIDALPPVSKATLTKIMEDLKDVAQMFVGGKFYQYILSEKQPEIVAE
ncbi:MAG TPA: phenylalanine--tRNA ligase beta subunit-related protein [Candidatus Nanoarchaeia archaeon]|nr:phenylalanine--tRNA ligase beta subunit-related protein [Candidatus Nanoarchaeia archaeon]